MTAIQNVRCSPPKIAAFSIKGTSGRVRAAAGVGLRAGISSSSRQQGQEDALTSVRMHALPPVVNWHLEPKCNYGCNFCFATFAEQKRSKLPPSTLLMQVPELLKAAGAIRVTFVGGEPFLHPNLPDLIAAAKTAGLGTTVVTNGSLLTEPLLRELKPHLDWLAFSIDASSDDIHTTMGRATFEELKTAQRPSASNGNGAQQSTIANADTVTQQPLITSNGNGAPQPPSVTNNSNGGSCHLQRTTAMWQAARRLGYRLKLNTVVCTAKLDDDMSDLVMALKPDRWKVFQVLPIEGQNDGRVDELLITEAQFKSWVERHRQKVAPGGIQVVAEANDQMQGTYAMLDARACFYSNTTGRYVYGPSLLEVGVEAAWNAVDGGFSSQGFVERGGLYDWGQSQDQQSLQDSWIKQHLSNVP